MLHTFIDPLQVSEYNRELIKIYLLIFEYNNHNNYASCLAYNIAYNVYTVYTHYNLIVDS